MSRMDGFEVGFCFLVDYCGDFQHAVSAIIKGPNSAICCEQVTSAIRERFSDDQLPILMISVTSRKEGNIPPVLREPHVEDH